MSRFDEISKEMLALTREYDFVRKSYKEVQEWFEKVKFGLDSQQKAYYAEEFELYAERIGELQADINNCGEQLNELAYISGHA